MRHTSQPYSHRLASPNQRLLTPVFSRAAMDEIRNLEVTPRQGVDLDKLRRFKGYVPREFPIQSSSYSFPLYTYYKSICALGQTNIARCLMGILTVIGRKATRACVSIRYLDDFIRKHLMKLSKESFLHVFDESPAYMFFMHLAALGGKAPHTKEQILSDITEWVAKKPPFPNQSFIDTQLNYLFTKFKIRPPGHFVSFSEFCDDPMLWATSGGAPKTTIEGTDYRNKWAWAFSHKITDDRWNDTDLYKVACSYPNDCKVALKEEPTKTREVITTPMASYLRQSYLAYRWGKLKINSPIGSGSFMTKFQSIQYRYYCALDGDRFDQTVPAEFILDIISRLGALDDETAFVAQEELKSMQNLHIVWDDVRLEWQGGVLSGWRLTSLIGSMLSWIIGLYIITNLNLHGTCDLAVLGDDIILYGSKEIPRVAATELYNQFGMVANLNKTTSGNVGEFLRKTYSPLGVLAYPALAARSIFYASPWLSSFTIDKYTDLTKNWLTFYSRLLPFRVNANIHHFIKSHILLDLTKAFGPNTQYMSFLNTPISVGGGGCSEWDTGSYTIVLPMTKQQQPSNLKRFLSIFGIEDDVRFRRAGTFVRVKDFTPTDISTLTRAPDILALPDNIPVSGIICNWFLNDDIPATHITKLLNVNIPKGLRTAGKSAILSALLGAKGAPSGLTSVQCTPEALKHYSQVTKNLVLSGAGKTKYPESKDLNLSVYLHNSFAFREAIVPYGTW